MSDINLNQKKIAFVSQHIDEQGCYEVFNRLAKDKQIAKILTRFGYSTKHYLLNTLDKKIVLDEFFECLPVDRPTLKKIKRKTYISKYLLQELRLFTPEVIVFVGLGYRLSRWILPKIDYDCKFVFQVGGATKDPILKFADYILAETDIQMKIDFKYHHNINRVSILPGYVPPQSFPISQKKQYDIVSVGRLMDFKNHKALLPLINNYRVIIVGDGENYEFFKKISSSNRNLIVTGYLKYDNVLKIISQSKIMVHPSKSEGFPRVFNESISLGVPLIALKETIQVGLQNYETLLLVKEEDLISKTIELLSDEKLYDYLKNNCIKYTSSKLSTENLEKNLKYIFNQITTVNFITNKSRIRYFLTIQLWMMKNLFFRLYTKIKTLYKKILKERELI